jgi:hypothetical protein
VIATLEQKLRALQAETEARVRKLPQAEAQEVRAAALARARDLVANPTAELRLVNRVVLPPPGETGRRRAGVR